MEDQKFPNPLKLDIGCGEEKLLGYQSVDLYLPADYADDICSLKSFPDNVADEVRTFHVLEHLPDQKLVLAMDNVFRILKPGGVWVIEVPDLIWVLQNFIDTPEIARWGWKMQTIFGLQNHEGEYHRTGFSIERLGSMLKESKFVKIEMLNYFSDKYDQGVIDAIAFKP